MSRPSVNGVPIADVDEAPGADELRQRAHQELLRQAAIAAGLLEAGDPPPLRGAISERAGAAIEALIDRVVTPPQPDEAACRRYHAAHAARYAVGERAQVRHILFAVTPGVDVVALRQRAEACLIDLRARSRGEADRFAQAAAELSNCPSGRQGGELGWLEAADCASEFAREVFGHSEVGVLPRLVHSRFGLHVVEVLARESGAAPAYEAVRAAVRRTLEQQGFATALRHYLQQLAAQAHLQGVPLDSAATPLVQ
jgi:peptidyl-prolyl cis-trans isomerase C